MNRSTHSHFWKKLITGNGFLILRSKEYAILPLLFHTYEHAQKASAHAPTDIPYKSRRFGTDGTYVWEVSMVLKIPYPGNTDVELWS